jgi:hypothetical protein
MPPKASPRAEEAVPPEDPRSFLRVLEAKDWELADQVTKAIIGKTTDPRTTCTACFEEFSSRTKLFKHLKATGHGTPAPAADAAAAASAEPEVNEKALRVLVDDLGFPRDVSVRGLRATRLPHHGPAEYDIDAVTDWIFEHIDDPPAEPEGAPEPESAPEPEAQPSAAPQPQEEPTAARPGAKVCRNFPKGRCTYGARCRFRHVLPQTTAGSTCEPAPAPAQAEPAGPSDEARAIALSCSLDATDASGRNAVELANDLGAPEGLMQQLSLAMPWAVWSLHRAVRCGRWGIVSGKQSLALLHEAGPSKVRKKNANLDGMHSFVRYGHGGVSSCQRCGMHGPSSETGPEYCRACKLCKVCCTTGSHATDGTPQKHCAKAPKPKPRTQPDDSELSKEVEVCLPGETPQRAILIPIPARAPGKVSIRYQRVTSVRIANGNFTMDLHTKMEACEVDGAYVRPVRGVSAARWSEPTLRRTVLHWAVLNGANDVLLSNLLQKHPTGIDAADSEGLVPAQLADAASQKGSNSLAASTRVFTEARAAIVLQSVCRRLLILEPQCWMGRPDGVAKLRNVGIAGSLTREFPTAELKAAFDSRQRQIQAKLDAAAAAAAVDPAGSPPGSDSAAAAAAAASGSEAAEDSSEEGVGWKTLADCDEDKTLYVHYLRQELRAGMKIKCTSWYDGVIGPEWIGDFVEIEDEDEGVDEDQDFPMVNAEWKEKDGSSTIQPYWVPARKIEIVGEAGSGAANSEHIRITTRSPSRPDQVRFWAYIAGSEGWTGRVGFRYRQRMPPGSWNTWGGANAEHKGNGWW